MAKIKGLYCTRAVIEKVGKLQKENNRDYLHLYVKCFSDDRVRNSKFYYVNLSLWGDIARGVVECQMKIGDELSFTEGILHIGFYKNKETGVTERSITVELDDYKGAKFKRMGDV
jgi:hypothetical protein